MNNSPAFSPSSRKTFSPALGSLCEKPSACNSGTVARHGGPLHAQLRLMPCRPHALERWPREPARQHRKGSFRLPPASQPNARKPFGKADALNRGANVTGVTLRSKYGFVWRVPGRMRGKPLSNVRRFERIGSQVGVAGRGAGGSIWMGWEVHGWHC
jgi:hypothetical protein